MSYGRSMLCPHTGLPIVKDIRENVQVRREMLKAAQGNPKVQQDLMAICRESIYIWFNYFVWTYPQWIVREDGHEVRETWDGRGRWKMFVVERRAKLAHAVVDPERKLMLDLDYTNNSRLREEASTLAATKWSSRWMIWLQDLLSTFAFFA